MPFLPKCRQYYVRKKFSVAKKAPRRRIANNFEYALFQLVSVLREVNYLGVDQIGRIPEIAADIYSSKESFRQLVANLELMVTWYNKILCTVLEVEYPLIQSQLENIDVQLREAEETLNWKTEGEVCLRRRYHE